MANIIHLTDNLQNARRIEGEESVKDVLKIASIGRLKESADLLIFPHSFSVTNDGISDLSILNARNPQLDDTGKLVSVEVTTENLMGFVGINNTSLSIHSRFTHKKPGSNEYQQDYFLYYMLQKVFSINVFSLEHSTDKDDKILNFLLFLFPYMLKQAMSQGLYKEYQTQHHDDARVHGVIDVNKVIRNDIPFRGRISYTTRQHSYDNSITQLVRHTIEYIKHHQFGASILSNDFETKECVSQIILSTPTYNHRDRERILKQNLKPRVHPYFLKYKALQELCVRILRHDSLKYGKEEDKVYGILFDGAWLWEEYLNTFLKDMGFKHPRNKESRGGIPMFVKPQDKDAFDNNSRMMYPDFYQKNYILDAKYKHLRGSMGREDLYQVVSYMYCMDAAFGGYAYPDEGCNRVMSYKLAGKGGGIIQVLPFHVPQNNNNWHDFIAAINASERSFSDSIGESLKRS